MHSCSLVPPMTVSVAMHIDNPQLYCQHPMLFSPLPKISLRVVAPFSSGLLPSCLPPRQSLTKTLGIRKRQPCMHKVCLLFTRPIQLSAFFLFLFSFLLSQLLCATCSFRPVLLPSRTLRESIVLKNPPTSFHNMRRATIHRPRTADPGPSSNNMTHAGRHARQKKQGPRSSSEHRHRFELLTAAVRHEARPGDGDTAMRHGAIFMKLVRQAGIGPLFIYLFSPSSLVCNFGAESQA